VILGIDYYGTLQAHPILGSLAFHVLDSGGEVHVISAVRIGNQERAERNIIKTGLTPHVIVCAPKDAPRLKYEACKALRVDLFIDDDPEIVNYLNERSIISLLLVMPIGIDYNSKRKPLN